MIDRIGEVVDWQMTGSPAAQIEHAATAGEIMWPSSMYMPVTAWDAMWAATIGFGS